MQAKKCDRCGAYYETNENKGIKGVAAMIGIIPLYKGCQSYPIDLCDNCINVFLEWIKPKEGD